MKDEKHMLAELDDIAAELDDIERRLTDALLASRRARLKQADRPWPILPPFFPIEWPPAGFTGCYFVALEGYVKIGFAVDVRKRLSGLQTAMPNELQLLAVVQDDVATEAYLHDRFAEYRHRGEWFQMSKPIRRYIRQLRQEDETIEEDAA